MQPGCMGTIQGLLALMALTGSVEQPGGMVLQKDPFGVRRRGDEMNPAGGGRARLPRHAARDRRLA